MVPYCCTEPGRLHLPSPQDPWCPFSRLHQPKVPARAPCQAWCLEANAKFGAVWRLYVNCVWWKMDFCAKNQPLWISLFLKLSFCSMDFVSNLWFLSWSFLFRWRHVQLFNLFWSHWHRSCSHHWKLFLQQLRWANPNLRFTTTSLPTTCPRNDKNEKTHWQQKTTTQRRHQKNMNIWTSPSSGMDFFKVGLKTSMWLYRAAKKTNHRLPLSSEERAGISCKPPGTSGILSTRRVALFKGKAPYIHPKSVSFEVCVETGAKVQLSKRGGNGTFDGSTPRNGASPMALGEQIPSFLTPAARLVTVTGPVHSVHAAWLGTKVWGVREDGWKATSFFLNSFFFFCVVKMS